MCDSVAADGDASNVPRPPNQSSIRGAFMATLDIGSAHADSQGLVTCRVCGEVKNISDFYASTLRACGTVGKCRDCTRAHCADIRSRNADYYKAYDRKRYRENEHRKEAARKSAVSPAGLASKAASIARMREEEPEKYKARNAVNNAIRDGRITRGTECYFCASTGRLHAHHEDYDHPLDVVWLCPSCHGKLHTIKGDFRRKAG